LHQPKNNPQIYFKMLHQKRETELFLSAVRLDLFSHLENWTTATEIAADTGFNGRNLSFYLNALACIGLLEKHAVLYRNTAQSNEFLNKNSPVYLGECILFRERMMSLENIDERVRRGPEENVLRHNQGVEVYDFYEGARVGTAEMYTGRLQSLLAATRQLFADHAPRRIMDLGGGSGILGIELVLAYPGSQDVIFEHPSVASLPRAIIAERGLTERIQVLEGDFNRDAIGAGYDLIIASGILDFAKDHLEALMAKMRQALTANGYLYLVTHEVSEDYQTPPESILGWLSSHLDGLDLLLPKKVIDRKLADHRFRRVQTETVDGALHSMQGEFYGKE
jgi:hypothetical protein